jgi:hypothetical protein
MALTSLMSFLSFLLPLPLISSAFSDRPISLSEHQPSYRLMRVAGSRGESSLGSFLSEKRHIFDTDI